jgi:hypothetical protein
LLAGIDDKAQPKVRIQNFLTRKVILNSTLGAVFAFLIKLVFGSNVTSFISRTRYVSTDPKNWFTRNAGRTKIYITVVVTYLS